MAAVNVHIPLARAKRLCQQLGRTNSAVQNNPLPTESRPHKGRVRTGNCQSANSNIRTFAGQQALSYKLPIWNKRPRPAGALLDMVGSLTPKATGVAIGPIRDLKAGTWPG